MQNILIDTDIGGDIDDALAIALALNSPELNVKGITTVFTGVEKRTQLTLKLLETFGVPEIPVASGAEKPLYGEWDKSLEPCQCSILTSKIPGNCSLDAVDLIIKLVLSNPGMTLTAIGPLTNIALAILKEPRIITFANLLLMGGMISGDYAEWNVLCDPEAASLVFNSGIPIKMVGLDVTQRCKFTREHIEKIRKSGNPKTVLLARLTDIFVERYALLPVLHDPLTVAALIWSGLMEFTEKKVLIETGGEQRGVTRALKDCFSDGENRYNALVCIDVDEIQFVRRLLERLIQ